MNAGSPRRKGCCTVIKKLRFTGTDYFAVAVFLIFAAVLATGLSFWDFGSDEPFYYAMAGRFAHGDRAFVDDWDLTQTYTIFLLLPYRIFTRLAGGTDGIILFMRYLFLAADLGCYWLLYLSMRRHMSYWSVPAATLFCLDFLAPALSYFNLCIFFLMPVSLLFILQRKKPSRARLVFIGILFSCAVLCEPMLAAAYLFFSVLAAVRTAGKQRGRDIFSSYAFLLDRTNWLWITVGIALSAAAYLCYNQATSGKQKIIRLLPDIFSSKEFKTSWYGSNGNPEKLRSTIGTFSPVGLGGLLAADLACLFFGRRIRERKALRSGVFVSALFFLAFCYIYMILNYENIFLYAISLPIILFGVVCRALCEEKNARMSALLAFSLICSLPVDYMSICRIGFAGRLIYFPTLYYAVRLFRELRCAEAEKPKQVRRLLGAARGVPCVCVALVLLVFFSSFGLNLIGSAGSATEITRGPYKGLKCSPENASRYEDSLSDLDMIGDSPVEPFYNDGKLSLAYLYLDRPAAMFSVYYHAPDATDRAIRYWEVFPERRPAYIYVSLYKSSMDEEGDLEQRLRFLSSICDFDRINGKAGYILRITGWKIPSLQEDPT